ncbi:DUF6894 family protein [Pararhizobium sp. DWP3-4]|uniref:DUF6894 family protein n=1 Tax=Pararhizobium sp. DWP3-4 TaxID=2804565 RepID=UPI003CF0F97C
MPKFYFHLRDGDTFEEDTDGVELPDVDSARSEAIIAAREILAEQISFGLQVGDQTFEVTDEEGFMFFRLAFRDLLHS